MDESTAPESESLAVLRPYFVPPKACMVFSGERKGQGNQERKVNRKREDRKRGFYKPTSALRHTSKLLCRRIKKKKRKKKNCF